MKIKIKAARELALDILTGFGFSREDSAMASDLIVEAELAGKPSHGLVRLGRMEKMIDDGRVTVTHEPTSLIINSRNALLVDGKKKPGFMVVPYLFDLAIKKIGKEKAGIMSAGATNTAPAAGMIGYFARRAAENDLIYLGFHNSMSYLVPFGSVKSLFGTNPMTIGIPSNDLPVIWDCSASKISVGDVVIANREGTKLKKGIALDKTGKPTTDPAEALAGGILPFAEHKGSGMSFIVELLAGALINSSITPDRQWNWGSFFILLDPSLFRPLPEFKTAVSNSITLLKNSPKAKGVKKIYFPGEKSQLTRKTRLQKGEFEISDNLYKELLSL